MSSLYPGGLDSFPTDRTNDTVMEDNHPGDHNNLADAVNKIEATLGVDPAAAYDTVVERLEAVSPVVLVETTNIASSLLLNLHTQPVELLPAPGGRLYYVVHSVVLHYRFVTTPYNETIAGGFSIGYGSTVGAVFGAGALISPTSQTGPDALFTKSEDAYTLPLGPSVSTNYWWTADDIEGKALSVAIGAGSLTGGDSTLTIRTFYSLIDGAP